jgi:hypothetical protein
MQPSGFKHTNASTYFLLPIFTFPLFLLFLLGLLLVDSPVLQTSPLALQHSSAR